MDPDDILSVSFSNLKRPQRMENSRLEPDFFSTQFLGAKTLTPCLNPLSDAIVHQQTLSSVCIQESNHSCHLLGITFIQTAISCHLDYCKSLLTGFGASILSLSPTPSQLPGSKAHVTSQFKTLLWLPNTPRINWFIYSMIIYYWVSIMCQILLRH